LTWQEILKSVGYPTDVLVLDFESYFDKDYSLKKMSTIEYITDSRFELQGLGMGFYGEGEDDSVHFITPSEIPICLSNRSWDNYTVVVQNAFFDTTILKEKFGLVPKFIVDIKDLSKHWDARESHRLADLAKHFKLKAKGDTLQFSGLRWETMRPDQRKDYIAYTKNDVEIEWELFKILLPRLTNAEMELKLARHTLDLYLNPRIKFNAEKAGVLKSEMKFEMSCCVQESHHTEKELRGNKSFVEILNAALPENELIPMKCGKNGDIPALAKDDEGLKYLLAHPDEQVRTLVKARQAVKSWPLHIKRIENLIKQAAASGGYLRIPLNYYGGHTGRWGGTEKINPQNFGSTGRAGRGTHELIAKVRELLESPEGFKFSITDSAQIEARILAWLAGQEDLINGFANNQDIYSEFASRLFGCEVRKPKGDDDSNTAKILQIRRGFGKDAILGCVSFGTPVLTDEGWKPIERVGPWDAVWDGRTWNLHDGVVCRGKKECIQINGTWLTPEHEILQGGEWTTAAEQHTHDRSAGINMENLRLSKFIVDNVAGLSPSNVVAPVVESLLRQETAWSQENLHAAMCVLKRHPGKLRLIKQLCLRRTKNVCLIEFVQSLADARLSQLKSMVNEVLESGPIGSQIESLFLNTWQHCQGGIIQDLKLTGLITTKDIDLVILDSLPGSRILETADILNSGRWHRFQIGGHIVSNCGFGMGSKKFYDRCLQNVDLRPLFDSGEYDYNFIDSLIKTYRTTYPRIPEFWSLVERCFKQVIKFPHQPIGIIYEGVNLGIAQEDLNKCLLTFWNNNGTVNLQLPSGRVLYYRHCRLDNEGGIRWQWGNLWGGSITENIVQSIARDLLGYWILEFEKRSLPVVIHIHDDITTLLKEDATALDAAVPIAIMKTSPDWAQGLPLSAEGTIADVYRK
jgi:hypothetical protein